MVGHGIELVPRVPFTIARVGSTDLPILVTCGDDQALIGSPGDPCAPQIADLRHGPDETAWRLVTTAFEVGWPAGFRIVSSPSPERPPGVDLVGPDECLLYIQGPYSANGVPPVDRMAAAGQTVAEAGMAGDVEWVWLRYRHDNAEWHQVHHVIALGREVFVVTLQALGASSSEHLRQQALWFAQSLRPYQGQPN